MRYKCTSVYKPVDDYSNDEMVTMIVASREDQMSDSMKCVQIVDM